ncbi:MAG: adenylate/guanylate cyclase domain-containing protein, partial [Hyphomicrobiaceae bacterium]
VQCALEIQLDLGNRPHLKETPLRIGIHLGEVIIEDDLPYGETLNIAARLESLAEPGGILVSGTVMDAVSARVSATFEDRGVPVLKNIPRRIPTYSVKPPPARSPADQTQSGLTNLDRTTRLDRNAIREILEGHVAAGGAASGTAAPPPVNSAPATPSDAPSAPAVAQAPEPVPEASPLPVAASAEVPVAEPDVPPQPVDDAGVDQLPAAEPPSAAGTVMAPPQPQHGVLDATVPLPAPDVIHEEQSDAVSEPGDTIPQALPSLEPGDDTTESRRPTLAEKLAKLPTSQAATPDPSAPAASPAETIAPAIAESQLEKTLPPQDQPLPNVPTDGRAAALPSAVFLDEITKALAVHVGPFSKLIVNREMKSNPNVFELISKLEEHIPNEDERLVFRVRASHINTNS